MFEKSEFILTDPEFEAEIFYLSKHEGGRSTPICSGYRGQFYYDTKNWDSIQQFINKSICKPGEIIKVLMKTTSPANHFGKLFVGKSFEVREGETIVGIGEITKIINSKFLKQELNKYELKVETAIVSSNQFGIETIRNLQSVKSTMYNAEEYRSIKSLLEQNKWHEIKETSKKIASFGEYLDIVTFLDEIGKKYIASIYDSDELWQDPELIEVILLQKQ
jgi:Elongation factor Tu C-terminal domain